MEEFHHYNNASLSQMYGNGINIILDDTSGVHDIW